MRLRKMGKELYQKTKERWKHKKQFAEPMKISRSYRSKEQEKRLARTMRNRGPRKQAHYQEPKHRRR